MDSRFDELERRIERLEREMFGGNYPGAIKPFGGYMDKCGCPIGSVCMNAACPHRMIVTCAAPTTQGDKG